MSDHIPDPGQHRTLFYAGYSSRVRLAPPPPPARELLRVSEHGDGWGVPAEWE
ncbi:MAG TPA: hypothetical protein VMT70_15690 [Vicinamibacteria bacterium]|nr:hypothetical protein [Vicinamibacteria bacterium]